MKEVLDLFSSEAGAYLRDVIIKSPNMYANDIEGRGCSYFSGGTNLDKKDFYARIKARMAEDRINKVPIRVRDGKTLGNGHHRVMLAYQLGLERMLATDDEDASGWASHLSGKVI